VLLISDDLDEVFALADRIAVMHHGRLRAARRRPTGRWRRSAWRWRALRPAAGGRHEAGKAPQTPAALLLAPLGAVLHAAGQLAAGGLGRRAGGPGLCAAARGRLRLAFALTETLTRATPLILTGLAAAVAFRRGCSTSAPRASSMPARWPRWRWAACMAAAASSLPPWLLFPMMLAAAALAGALLLLGPALLKSRWAWTRW
jgi:hypothetical protein